MSKTTVRTRSNLAGRGSKKRFITKIALKEPPQPKNDNTIRPRGNPTPGSRLNKHQTLVNHKQPLKNGDNHSTEGYGNTTKRK